MCTKGQPYKFRQIYKFREQRLSVAFNDHQTQLQIGSKIPYHKNRTKNINVHPKIFAGSKARSLNIDNKSKYQLGCCREEQTFKKSKRIKILNPRLILSVNL